MTKTKSKYKFNTNSLEYEKIGSSFHDKLMRLLSIIGLFIVFSVLFIFLAYKFIDSPKEKILKREIAQYELQFDILNDRTEKISKVLKNIQERDDNIYRIIFGADPIPSSIRKAGYGGIDRYSSLEGYQNSDIIKNTTTKIDKISRELHVQSKSFDDVLDLVKNKEKMMSCIPAIQPISNKQLTRIASGFGYRIHPIYKTYKMHEGIDFSASSGTPIYATGDGKIKRSKKIAGYGNVCVINHGFGYQTLYAHMKKIIVRSGQRVKRGQIIGYVGNTGLSTGPHLHYEVILNSKKVDPVHYFYNDLSPSEYEKVIELSSRINQSLS